MSLFISFWVSIGSRMPQANLRAQRIEIGKLDLFVVSNANWTYKGRYLCMEILWRPNFLYGCGGGGCDSFGIRKVKIWVSISPVEFVEISKIM